MSGRPRHRSIALAAVALGTLLATATRSAAAAPRWQAFPGKADADPGVLTTGWAANRVWVEGTSKGAPSLWSARLTGNALTSFAQTRLPVASGIVGRFPIVDGEVVVLATRDGTVGYVSAPLLANGQLGASRVLAYDDLLARAKEATAAKLASVQLLDGVRVGERIVWALDGTRGCNGCQGYFLVCCSESGAAVDLSQFIDRHLGVLFLHVGRDTQGRIWLAWLDRRNHSGAILGAARILELDASTLAPRSRAVAIPRVVASRVELACDAACRLVAQTAGGQIVSWAPGERSATRVASAYRFKVGSAPAWLLAATYGSGRLVVAYQGAKGKTRYADATVRDKVRIVRGDARGARAREIAAIPVANGRAGSSGPGVHATFVPGGLVAVETFEYTPGYGPSPLIGAFVPLRP